MDGGQSWAIHGKTYRPVSSFPWEIIQLLVELPETSWLPSSNGQNLRCPTYGLDKYMYHVKSKNCDWWQKIGILTKENVWCLFLVIL
jgi:hypothetical protein